MMNKQTVSAFIGMFLCASVCAVAQPKPATTHQPVAGKNIGPPLTPEQKERLDRGYQLWKDGAAALDQGKYAEAEDDARQGLALGSAGLGCDEVLVQALAAEGKTQEAFDLYKQMVKMGEWRPRNLLPYSLILLKSGQWAQAVAVYNKTLPFITDGYFTQARDLMKSHSSFSPDVTLPTDLETAIHVGIGLTYNDEGTLANHTAGDKALKEYQMALSLEPDSPLANLFYAEGLNKLGRRKEAIAAFKKTSSMSQGDIKAAAKEALSDLGSAE